MKTALVTGATSGIGREIAKSLSAKGWRILLHGRDSKKLGQTCQGCNELTEPFQADLSSLEATRQLATAVRSLHPQIDALILNAGTVTKKREVTPEGFERMFAVNHLAPFLLTKELIPTLQSGSHILVVSTDAHRWIKSLDLENLQAEKSFRVLKHYAATKAANLLASLEWARRLKPEGIRLSAHHPGEVATGFGLHGPLWLRLFWKLSARRFLSPAEAATPMLKYLDSPQPPETPAPYFSKGKPVSPAPFILDPSLQQKLWNTALTLTDTSNGS